MKNSLASLLLVVFAIVLGSTNIMLAKKVTTLERQMPDIYASIAQAQNTPVYAPTPTPTPFPVATNAPLIESITPTTGKSGTVVTVTGVDFLPTGNEVVLGKTWIASATSRNGTTLKFTIPSRLVVCSGEYAQEICKIQNTSSLVGTAFSVWIKNSYGTSNSVPLLIRK